MCGVPVVLMPVRTVSINLSLGARYARVAQPHVAVFARYRSRRDKRRVHASAIAWYPPAAPPTACHAWSERAQSVERPAANPARRRTTPLSRMPRRGRWNPRAARARVAGSADSAPPIMRQDLHLTLGLHRRAHDAEREQLARPVPAESRSRNNSMERPLRRARRRSGGRPRARTTSRGSEAEAEPLDRHPRASPVVALDQRHHRRAADRRRREARCRRRAAESDRHSSAAPRCGSSAARRAA